MAPKTLIDAYNRLQTKSSILKDLKKYNTRVCKLGYEPQETYLRVLANTGCIHQFEGFTSTKGNFSKGEIDTINNQRECFYDNNGNPIKANDNGDKSDNTMMNSTSILATTSKNTPKGKAIGNLDVVEIESIQKTHYPNKKLIICIVVPDKEKFYKMLESSRDSTCAKKILQRKKDDLIVLDHSDLVRAHERFKQKYLNKPIETILNQEKPIFCSRFHQRILSFKIIKLKNQGKKKIGLFCVCRTGKSYIVAKVIMDDSKEEEECNYLFITTAKKETVSQLINDVFNYVEFVDFNVKLLEGGKEESVKKSVKKNKKNIIIVSIDYLKNTTGKNAESHTVANGKISIKKLTWLKKLNFNFTFMDECHKGGSTARAKEIVKYYCVNTPVVFITATYSKPVLSYGINKSSWVSWGLDDNKMLTKFQGNKWSSLYNNKLWNSFKEKHPEATEILRLESPEDLVHKYNKIPELNYLTWNLKDSKSIIMKTKDNSYGWSPEAVFTLKNNTEGHIPEFQNKNEALKIWYNFFGKKGEFGIPDSEYPDEIVFMKRIENLCKNGKRKSRLPGQGTLKSKPMVIMAFLPVFTNRGEGYLKNISLASKKLLEEYKICDDYLVISLNDDNVKDPSESIKHAEAEAIRKNKKGVLVLTGTKCHLGITIKNCDIVLLLNNFKEQDKIYQMMFRCMNEAEDKGQAFIVDYDLNRAVKTVIDYSYQVKPKNHPKAGLKYIFQERLLSLNADHWCPVMGKSPSELDFICNNVYEIYQSDFTSAITNLLNKLGSFALELPDELQKMFNVLNMSPSKLKKKAKKEKEEEEEKIKKGLEVTKVDSDGEKAEKEEEEVENVNFSDIIKYITPLMCFITKDDYESTDLNEMYKIIKANKEKFNILLNQTITWWGKCIDEKLLEEMFCTYSKYMADNMEIVQIITTLKELFIKHRDDGVKLSEIVDTYFHPTELEKTENAEVTTMRPLRKEILELEPLEEVYTNPDAKFLEPCCGKGGIVIDVVEKFMVGLKEHFPNREERKKHIVENIIHFSDINPTNIYITKELLCLDKDYNINYHLGNTLELGENVEWPENWPEKFDLQICNPPYEAMKSGKRKAQNHNLWSAFLDWSNKRMKDNGYMLYITPTSWMSPQFANKEIFYDNQLLYLNVNECAKHFPGVGSTFSYYLIKNSKGICPTKVVCKHNKKIYESECVLKDLDYLPTLLNNHTISIIKKMKKEWEGEKVSFRTKSELHNTTKKAWLSNTESEEHRYLTRHTTKYEPGRWSKVKHSLHDENKILLNLSGNLNPIYDNGTMGFTQAQMYLLTDNEEYVETLKSKLFKFVFKISKWSGFQIEKIFHDLPFVCANTDEELYKIFNLTGEEIKMIEENS